MLSVFVKAQKLLLIGHRTWTRFSSLPSNTKAAASPEEDGGVLRSQW
jgi:hypothetical protein